MHHVFISYSRIDLAIVDEIAAALSGVKIPTWVDRRDIPVSTPWFEVVCSAVRDADLVVVCNSPAWAESQACMLELSVAETAHKAVFTFDVAGCDPAAVARHIVDRLAGLPERVRTHTEVLARTAGWHSNDRSPRALLPAALVTPARKLLRSGTPQLATDAREFVLASVRRRRLRRWTTSTCALLACAAVVACCTGALISRAASDQGAANDASVGAYLAAAEDVGKSPYRVLAEAIGTPNSPPANYSERLRLLKAMEPTFPDDSFTVTDGHLVGFAPGPDQPTAIDDNGDGHPVAGPARSATAPVRTFAASSDGTTRVSSTAIATVVTAGPRTSTGPAAEQVAVSADGTVTFTVASGAARVRATASGDVREATVPAECTAAAMISDTAIVGTARGELLTWGPGSRPTTVWSRPTSGAIRSVAVAPDGSRVAIVGERDGLVRVLTVPGFVQERALAVPGRPGAASFSPDGRRIAIAVGADVAMFDLRTGGSPLRTLVGSVGTVRHLAWSAHGDRVWAIAGENRVTAWPARTGHVLLDNQARWFVAVVGPLPDGRMVVVDRNGDVTHIDPTRRTAPVTTHTAGREVVAVALSPNGATIALGTARGVVMHRLDTTGADLTFDTGCRASSLAYAPKGDRLYNACRTEIFAIDPAEGHVLARGQIPVNGAYAVSVDRHGTVFVGSGIGEVFTFDAILGARREISGAQGCLFQPNSIAVSSAGDVVIYAGDGALHVGCTPVLVHDTGGWHMVHYQQPAGDGEQSRSLALTPDGSLAAIGLSDGTVRFWNPESLDNGGVHHNFGGDIRGVAFTTDQANVVTVSRDGLVESLPVCPLCGSVDSLVARAQEILRTAKQRGLDAT